MILQHSAGPTSLCTFPTPPSPPPEAKTAGHRRNASDTTQPPQRYKSWDVGDTGILLKENIAKGTTDPRVEFCLPKFKQIQTQILIKFHLQNHNQALTSKLQPNISISTKLKIQNIDQS